MAPKETAPKVTWIVTSTGVAAQDALSNKAKQAKRARKAPTQKVLTVEE
jgi:hypothetical protein